MKYLGIKIGENLNWKQHTSEKWQMLSKQRNAILTKLRHFIDRKTLKSISCNIYVVTYLFRHKIQIQLKKILFWKKNPYGLYTFEITMLIDLLYLENPTSKIASS